MTICRDLESSFGGTCIDEMLECGGRLSSEIFEDDEATLKVGTVKMRGVVLGILYVRLRYHPAGS